MFIETEGMGEKSVLFKHTVQWYLLYGTSSRDSVDEKRDQFPAGAPSPWLMETLGQPRCPSEVALCVILLIPPKTSGKPGGTSQLCFGEQRGAGRGGLHPWEERAVTICPPSDFDNW